ncbi:MAG: hypothetical protein ACI8PZ_006507, partial [Myxococcota bacterium]
EGEGPAFMEPTPGQWARRAGMVVVVLAAVSGSVAFTAASGANAVAEHTSRMAMAEQGLSASIEKHVGLVPDLVALAGPRIDLSAELAAVQAAAGLEARAVAVERLNDKMVSTLARVPPDADTTLRVAVGRRLNVNWSQFAVARRRLAEQRAQAPGRGRLDVVLASAVGW